jgi:hypothetical protein
VNYLAAVAGPHQHGSDKEQIGFCSYCGQIGDDAQRVCASCGLGVRLQTDRHALTSGDAPFLIVRGDGLVSAASATAERELPRQGPLVGRPLLGLFTSPDGDLGSAVALAASGNDRIIRIPVEPLDKARRFRHAFQATIAPCAHPRAALVVIDRVP